jgi:hypothetical protein
LLTGNALKTNRDFFIFSKKDFKHRFRGWQRRPAHEDKEKPAAGFAPVQALLGRFILTDRFSVLSAKPETSYFSAGTASSGSSSL